MEPEKAKTFSGPYRATRLWNEAIRTFNNGMPVKKHWKQLRQYENCFTASEAVVWLHGKLITNPHFGPSVTKDQISQLLCKFLKAGVFEDVRGESSVENFKDNSGLYRLTNRSPFKNPRTPSRVPLASLNANKLANEANAQNCSPTLKKHERPNHYSRQITAQQATESLSECRLTAKQFSQEEVDSVWKNCTLGRLARVLGLEAVDEILNPAFVQGSWVAWNVSHVGPRGVVRATPQEEGQVPPPWVLYGMKALSNWPISRDDRLPNYPNSHVDVFKVICDYFTNTSGPLTTYSLYQTFARVFFQAENLSQPQEPQKENSVHFKKPKMLTSMASIESLMLDMSINQQKTSTPNVINGVVDTKGVMPDFKQSLNPTPVHKGFSQRFRSLRYRKGNSFAPSESAWSQKMASTSNLPVALSSQLISAMLTPNTCFETAFTSDQPETRIIPQQSMDQYHSKRYSVAAPSSETSSIEQPSSFTRCSNTRSSIRRRMIHNDSFTKKEPCPDSYSSLDRMRNRSGGFVNLVYGSADNLNQSEWQCSSLSSLASFRTPRSFMSSNWAAEGTDNAGRDYENLREFSHLLSRSLVDLNPESPYRDSSNDLGLVRYRCSPRFLTEEGENLAITAFQLLCLILPPGHRRRLHLLLRFMSKVAANGNLVLEPGVVNRSLMVNTFYRCIICAAEEADYDELLAVRIVSFMMDHCETIMAIPPVLCSHVRDRLLEMQKAKIRFQPDDTVPLAYCVQLSPKSYQQQSLTASQQALQALLDQIVENRTMADKERRKRLQQFKEAYPEIFRKKFPTPESEAAYFLAEKSEEHHNKGRNSKLKIGERLRRFKL